MPVYVDDMAAKFGRMVMCHLTADTLEELHAMADTIGVSRNRYQGPPVTRMPHYDIAQSKRALAVKAGAIEIKWRESPKVARRCLASMQEEEQRTKTVDRALIDALVTGTGVIEVLNSVNTPPSYINHDRFAAQIASDDRFCDPRPPESTPP